MPPPRTVLRALPGPAGAPGAFVLPLRKLVLSFCPADAASAGMRAWLAREAEAFARARRSVEVVVQEVPHRQPLAKGFYSEWHGGEWWAGRRAAHLQLADWHAPCRESRPAPADWPSLWRHGSVGREDKQHADWFLLAALRSVRIAGEK